MREDLEELLSETSFGAVWGALSTPPSRNTQKQFILNRIAASLRQGQDTSKVTADLAWLRDEQVRANSKTYEEVYPHWSRAIGLLIRLVNASKDYTKSPQGLPGDDDDDIDYFRSKPMYGQPFLHAVQRWIINGTPESDAKQYISPPFPVTGDDSRYSFALRQLPPSHEGSSGSIPQLVLHPSQLFLSLEDESFRSIFESAGHTVAAYFDKIGVERRSDLVEVTLVESKSLEPVGAFQRFAGDSAGMALALGLYGLLQGLPLDRQMLISIALSRPYDGHGIPSDPLKCIPVGRLDEKVELIKRAWREGGEPEERLLLEADDARRVREQVPEPDYRKQILGAGSFKGAIDHVSNRFTVLTSFIRLQTETALRESRELWMSLGRTFPEADPPDAEPDVRVFQNATRILQRIGEREEQLGSVDDSHDDALDLRYTDEHALVEEDVKGVAGPSKPQEERISRVLAWREAWQQLPTPRRAVVLGGGGRGKTWLLQRQAIQRGRELLEAAHGGTLQDVLRDSTLPLYIRCTEVASVLSGRITRGKAAMFPLASFLPIALENMYGVSADDIRSILTESRLKSSGTLLLFDGLDEVPPEKRGTFRKYLREWSSDIDNQASIIVASRPAGYEANHPPILNPKQRPHEQLPDKQQLLLLAMSEQQQDEFVRDWFQDDEDQAISFIQLVRAQSALQTMMGTPILLGFLCNLFETKDEINLRRANRSDVYEWILNKLLRRKHKEIEKVDDLVGEDAYIENQLVHLSLLALSLFARGLRLFTEREARKYLKKAEYPDDVFPLAEYSTFAIDEGSIKAPLVENEIHLRRYPFTQVGSIGRQVIYQFLHYSIQEYLAGRALAYLAAIHDMDGIASGWAIPICFFEHLEEPVDGEISKTEIVPAWRTYTVAQFVDRKTWDPRYEDVLLFLAGRLANSEKLREKPLDAEDSHTVRLARSILQQDEELLRSEPEDAFWRRQDALLPLMPRATLFFKMYYELRLHEDEL